MFFCLKNTLYSVESLLDLLFLGTKRYSYVPLSVGAEDEAGGDEDTSLMEHTLRQVLYIGILLRDLAPEEHTHLTLVVGTAQDIHNLLSIFATTAIGFYIKLTMPSLIILIRLSSSQLNTPEGTALNVRLYFEDP